jgi:hypothetical protein
MMSTLIIGSRNGVTSWLLAVSLALSPVSLCAQEKSLIDGDPTTTGDPESPGVFSLGLDMDRLSGERRAEEPEFSLGVFDQQAAIEVEVVPEPKGQLEFSLFTGVGDEGASLPGIGLEFYDELAARRWPGAKTRLSAHLAAQFARVLEGGRVGAYGGDVGVLRTLDWVAMARLAVLWWQTYKLGQLPPGASIPTDATLTLVVRDADGRTPGHISVLPLTQGWIGDAVHARCDPYGRCVAKGLPSASSTLLVRGDGGSIVRWDHIKADISVSLKPTGLLQILPAQCCPEIRVLEEKSDAVVPVIQWVNPGREDWVRVSPSGLTLSLPVGRYKIQTNQNSERSFIDATVTADQVTTVEVVY